jgi:hypothetical protein
MNTIGKYSINASVIEGSAPLELFNNGNAQHYPWKEFFHLGIEIKKVWSTFGEEHDLALYTDINNIKNELYSSLKEYLPLPRLRKENAVLESELNSSFQTYLFDVLNDQDDLYEFYNYDLFDNSNNNLNNSSVLVRNDNLPLTDSLENIHYVLKEFKSDSDKQNLAKLRWYSSDEILK